jgi:hypothetical protein
MSRCSRSTRWRARRSTSQDDEPERRTSAGVEWAGPSRRARVLAVVLALLLAVVTFAVVSYAWRRAAPPPPAPRTSVEVKLVPAPAAPMR